MLRPGPSQSEGHSHQYVYSTATKGNEPMSPFLLACCTWGKRVFNPASVAPIEKGEITALFPIKATRHMKDKGKMGKDHSVQRIKSPLYTWNNDQTGWCLKKNVKQCHLAYWINKDEKDWFFQRGCGNHKVERKSGTGKRGAIYDHVTDAHPDLGTHTLKCS